MSQHSLSLNGSISIVSVPPVSSGASWPCLVAPGDSACTATSQQQLLIIN